MFLKTLFIINLLAQINILKYRESRIYLWPELIRKNQSAQSTIHAFKCVTKPLLSTLQTTKNQAWLALIMKLIFSH